MVALKHLFVTALNRTYRWSTLQRLLPYNALYNRLKEQRQNSAGKQRRFTGSKGPREKPLLPPKWIGSPKLMLTGRTKHHVVSRNAKNTSQGVLKKIISRKKVSSIRTPNVNTRVT